MADTSIHGRGRLPDGEEDWQEVLEEVEDNGPPDASALLLERNGELALELRGVVAERDRIRGTLAAVVRARDRAEGKVVYWRMTSAAVTALCLLLLCLFALEAWR